MFFLFPFMHFDMLCALHNATPLPYPLRGVRACACARTHVCVCFGGETRPPPCRHMASLREPMAVAVLGVARFAESGRTRRVCASSEVWYGHTKQAVSTEARTCPRTCLAGVAVFGRAAARSVRLLPRARSVSVDHAGGCDWNTSSLRDREGGDHQR
jgi:hypothetical protein